MVLTIASFKGGVGKTTTAVHLAGFLQTKGKTLLVDGDPNLSATAWSKRGAGFAFDVRGLGDSVTGYHHVVIDSEAGLKDEDLLALARNCDRLVLPVTPDVLSVGALLRSLETLRNANASWNYRILLTVVPPMPSTAGKAVWDSLKAQSWPVLRARIRRLTAFQRAALEGCLVHEVRGDRRASSGWDDYRSCGRELL